jgi:hypothetical protein
MHNVLKGHRFLEDYLKSKRPVVPECVYVPVLNGVLGPGHAWPATVDKHQRFAVPAAQATGLTDAVVATLADDVRMQNVVSGGDLALLDQSLSARCMIDPEGLYVLKRGNSGVIRRLRTSGRNVFIATDDSLAQPAAWERISLEIQHIQRVVRARATLLAREPSWVA